MLHYICIFWKNGNIFWLKIFFSAYQMRYGNLCEEKMINAKIKHGHATLLDLLWYLQILEVRRYFSLQLNFNSFCNSKNFSVITEQNWICKTIWWFNYSRRQKSCHLTFNVFYLDLKIIKMIAFHLKHAWGDRELKLSKIDTRGLWTELSVFFFL